MEYQAKILIVDESPASRSIIREGLLRAGYTSIEESTNGEEALLKISRLHPDVVLLDMWLSKLDGIGVLRSCRNMDWGQHMRAVVRDAIRQSNRHSGEPEMRSSANQHFQPAR